MTLKKRVEFISRIPIGTHLTCIRAGDYGQAEPQPSVGVFAGLRLEEGRDMVWLKRDLGGRDGQLVAIDEIHNLGVELDAELRPRGDSHGQST